MTYRSFAYFRWCQFVVGFWRKMRYSLTFYFVDFILVWNVSCYIFLSCIVRHWISWFEGINENHENWCSTNKNEFRGCVRKRTWANLPLPSKYSSSSSNTTKTESSTLRVHKDRNYDKREYFNFSIMNFPFVCSNIPAVPAYDTIFQGMWFRVLLLTRKLLLHQGSLVIKLGSSLRTMTCVTDTEYLRPKWPRICSSYRYHNLVVYKFMT